MDREDLSRQTQETLTHLHNPAYLSAHPLAALLGGEHPLAGDALRRLLLEMIEQLKPAQSAPTALADWRRYRHIVLRYVEGHSMASVARELAVSHRQASRDHQQAIDALAMLVKVRCSIPRLGVAARPAGLPDLAGARAEPETEAMEPAGAGESSTSLAEVVAGVLATLGKLLPDRQSRVELSVADTLPPVAVAPALLRQALLHLLIYATEAARGGEVSFAAADAAPGVTIRIGVGSPGGEPLSRHPHSAEPVELRELVEGARQLIVDQGGTVEVGDGIKRPRLVTVVLPAVERRKVLVVDDNPDVVMLFRRYLRGKPYRLIQATSGAGALRLAGELRPDVIILDVLIPSEDGWDILHKLRAAPGLADTPVVVCSVLPERALARSLRVAEFLPKPVTCPALLAALERCVGVGG
ncbi:MAG: response regulator [Chloroflexi bacterium]|nr:response regulator [Chloroflexota bacterium]